MAVKWMDSSLPAADPCKIRPHKMRLSVFRVAMLAWLWRLAIGRGGPEPVTRAKPRWCRASPIPAVVWPRLRSPHAGTSVRSAPRRLEAQYDRAPIRPGKSVVRNALRRELEEELPGALQARRRQRNDFGQEQVATENQDLLHLLAVQSGGCFPLPFPKAVLDRKSTR